MKISKVTDYAALIVMILCFFKNVMCHIPLPILFAVNRHFALYKFVHGKHGACLIGYLCTSVFALFIQVDKFHLLIISLFDLCGS